VCLKFRAILVVEQKRRRSCRGMWRKVRARRLGRKLGNLE